MATHVLSLKCRSTLSQAEGAEVLARKKQRYQKLELIGQGACKKVYKGFDECEGIEVAWNEVDTRNCLDKSSRRRLFDEIRVLSSLKHKNVMALYDHWFDQQQGTLVFITELFTGGSLRQYRKRHKRVEELVLKRWAFQVLQALVYLHGHNPPIIHRDLKCDNIFINGVSGEVKIGDLGLATIKDEMTPLSMAGTPEFMAPELYDEDYDAKVDVYSFGMCMLELATMDFPYSECSNHAQIFRRVSQGIPPLGLSKVASHELREFIQLCMNFDPHQRPEARQLLKHPFFNAVRPPSRNMLSLQQSTSFPSPPNPFSSYILANYSIGCPVSPVLHGVGMPGHPLIHAHSAPLPPLPRCDSTGTSSSNASSSTAFSSMEAVSSCYEGSLMYRGLEDMQHSAPIPCESEEFRDWEEGEELVQLFCEELDQCTLDFKLKLYDRTGWIGFSFNLLEDTAESVTSEMVDSLALHLELAEIISHKITECISRRCSCCLAGCN